MIKDCICREYLEEIERLERSIRELEEEIIELRMQVRKKTEEVTSLSIENTSLRRKIELLERREKYITELLKKMKVPLILIDEDEFEDVDVSE
jgi:regulator of replication initiation timing